MPAKVGSRVTVHLKNLKARAILTDNGMSYVEVQLLEDAFGYRKNAKIIVSPNQISHK